MRVNFLRMMLKLAAIKRIPVSSTVKPVPGMKDVNMPVKKSTMKKWFKPKMPKGRANKTLPRIDRFFISNDFVAVTLLKTGKSPSLFNLDWEITKNKQNIHQKKGVPFREDYLNRVWTGV